MWLPNVSIVYYRSQYSCIFHHMVILPNEANVVIIECTCQFTLKNIGRNWLGAFIAMKGVMLLPFTIILILWKWPLPQYRWQRPFLFHHPYFLIGDKTGKRRVPGIDKQGWCRQPGDNISPGWSQSISTIISFKNCFKFSYFYIQWVFFCLRVYGGLRVQQGYELSPLHSSKWSHNSLHTDPRCATKLSANQNCICILLSKKQRMYMQIKMVIDQLNLSKQMAGKIFFFFNVQYTYVLS